MSEQTNKEEKELYGLMHQLLNFSTLCVNSIKEDEDKSVIFAKDLNLKMEALRIGYLSMQFKTITELHYKDVLIESVNKFFMHNYVTRYDNQNDRNLKMQLTQVVKMVVHSLNEEKLQYFSEWFYNQLTDLRTLALYYSNQDNGTAIGYLQPAFLLDNFIAKEVEEKA